MNLKSVFTFGRLAVLLIISLSSLRNIAFVRLISRQFRFYILQENLFKNLLHHKLLNVIIFALKVDIKINEQCVGFIVRSVRSIS